MLIWLMVGLGTSVIALWGYRFQPLGCSAAGSLRFNCTGMYRPSPCIILSRHSSSCSSSWVK